MPSRMIGEETSTVGMSGNTFGVLLIIIQFFFWGIGMHLGRQAHSFQKVSVRTSTALELRKLEVLSRGACVVEPVAFVPEAQNE